MMKNTKTVVVVLGVSLGLIALVAGAQLRGEASSSKSAGERLQEGEQVVVAADSI